MWEKIRSFFWITQSGEKYDRPGVELLIWLLLATFLLFCYRPLFLDGHVCRIEMWGIFCPTLVPAAPSRRRTGARVSRFPSSCTRCTLELIFLCWPRFKNSLARNSSHKIQTCSWTVEYISCTVTKYWLLQFDWAEVETYSSVRDWILEWWSRWKRLDMDSTCSFSRLLGSQDHKKTCRYWKNTGGDCRSRSNLC